MGHRIKLRRSPDPISRRPAENERKKARRCKSRMNDHCGRNLMVSAVAGSTVSSMVTSMVTRMVSWMASWLVVSSVYSFIVELLFGLD